MTQKDAAIDCGLVGVVAPLLFCEVMEVRRLAAGNLTAVTVTKRGKVELIKNLAALEQLCVCSAIFVSTLVFVELQPLS